MRRLLLPFGLVVAAVTLGAFVLGPSTTSASPKSTASVSSGVLTDSSSSSTSASLADGQQLFDQTCSSCHTVSAGGGVLAPNLRGLGAATVDLWVGTGLMPLSVPTAEPIRKPDLFDAQQTLDIANYVQSLTPGKGVPIPVVDTKDASVSTGFDLFSLNCAPCHTITGAGDALSNGLEALPLHGLTPVQVAEAIETAPGNMPRFEPGALTATEANDVVAYVTEDIEHPANPGGIGLGGVGPVAEGFIGLFVGVGVCMLIALWIGERSERDEPESEHGHGEPEGAHV